MAVFLYEAKNLEGQPIKNKMEARTKEDVIQSLRQRGYFPLSVTEEGTGLNREITFDSLEKITLKDLALFCRQFSFVMQSGMPMLKAIDLSMEQCEKPKMKEILKRVHSQIQKGRSLSEALKHEDNIPELMVNMIAAGEMSGKLDSIMFNLGEYYNKQHRQKQKVSQALMYPKIVITFATVVVIGMMTWIVPDFLENISGMGGEMPALTLMLMSISTLLKKFWYIWVSVVVVGIGVKKLIFDRDEKYIIRKGKRQIDGRLFGKLNKQIVAGRFASTFSILLSSGLGVLQALEISSKVLENKYIEMKLEHAKDDIKKGNPIGKTLEDLNIFPRMLTQMITVGEETGQLDDIMNKTAEFYEGETDAAIQKMVSMIEPMIIIGLAFIVGFIVLALFLPMISMYDAVGNM